MDTNQTFVLKQPSVRKILNDGLCPALEDLGVNMDIVIGRSDSVFNSFVADKVRSIFQNTSLYHADDLKKLNDIILSRAQRFPNSHLTAMLLVVIQLQSKEI